MTASETSGLSDTAAGSVLWMTAQKWFNRIGGLVTVVILARLLEPADFGLVAIALSIIPFLYLLADLGFSAYLIQTDDPSPELFSTAFWYALSAGLILALALGFLGYPLQLLLGVEHVVPIMWALSPAVFIVAIGSVPNAILRRNMRFDAIAQQAMIAGTVSQIAAIILALNGFGVWALIAQTLVSQVITTLLIWRAAKWLPSLAFGFTEFRRMAIYGVNVVAVEFVALGRGWAENTIVASTLGLNGLGYLNVAQRLIVVAQDLTVTAITPVSVVVFSQLRVDARKISAAYELAQSAVYALVIPVMVFIAVCAPTLIPMVFGEQWGASVIPAQALAIAGILTTGASLDHGLLYGLGKPAIWFFYALAVDAATVAMTFILAPHGLGAVTFGFVCVALFATLARWPLIGRQIQLKVCDLAEQFGRALILALVTGTIGALAYVLGNEQGRIVAILAAGLSISVSWLGAVYLLFPSALAEGKRLALQFLGKFRPAPAVVDG